jgi:cytochrome oxidase Cu insertion factor (SCO1/SenC/PrrC family)
MEERIMLRKAIGLLMLVALLAATASAQQPQPGGTAPPKTHLKIGDKAPDFTLKGVNGKEVKLSRLKGKTMVVLAFYPKAFTGG